MSEIEVRVFPEKDLTVLVARGTLQASEIVQHASRSYKTNLVLWDVRQVVASELSKDEYDTIAQFMRTLSMPREKGKTALVGNEGSIELELLHKYKAMMGAKDVPIEYQVFTSIKDARNWLGVLK